MKYVPPLGATDPNASYQDGNPEAGILGSIVPAAAIERPQREILNVLTAAGLTPSDTDLTQLLAAIRKIIGTQNAELERLRLLKIGCPMYWRSTTLPEGFAWVNGDLVLFEDWPEFAAVYNAGGFSGMVLPYDADSATIAANLGKFRPNAANPTGLYLPSCGEQFFRGWTGGGTAGAHHDAGLPNVTGGGTGANNLTTRYESPSYVGATMIGSNLEAAGHTFQHIAANGIAVYGGILLDLSRGNPIYGNSVTVMPASVDLPVMMYLGNSV